MLPLKCFTQVFVQPPLRLNWEDAWADEQFKSHPWSNMLITPCNMLYTACSMLIIQSNMHSNAYIKASAMRQIGTTIYQRSFMILDHE